MRRARLAPASPACSERPSQCSLALRLLRWSLHAFALGDVTIYDSAQSVPVGGRAAGMGGAYTALACDEGALHYNPASLSCAAASHLELTANAYVLQGLRATGALGPGQNVSATTFHAIPSIVGAVHILSEGSERTFFDTSRSASAARRRARGSARAQRSGTPRSGPPAGASRTRGSRR
jgi:hypothetical protein